MRQPLPLAVLSFCAFLCAVAISSANAQQAAPPDTARTSARLRVFLDCDFCDFDFMRTEITFVDYVRNRQDAQVHILVTDQTTGGVNWG